MHVNGKVNLPLKFLHSQNCFLTPLLCRLLCKALIELLFDYACTNMYMRFCLHSISVEKVFQGFCTKTDSMFMTDTYNFLYAVFLNFATSDVLTIFCIVIICCPCCNAVNFEINLSLLSKPCFYITKCQDKNVDI